MASGRPAESLAAYRRALELHPGRRNRPIGAARAAIALGNEEEAEASYAAVVQRGMRDSDWPRLQETVGDMEASNR
jgi:hypothetical protein